MKWYYAQNNQRHGPISESEFDFLVHQKKIRSDMLVWNETMPGWLPLREVMPTEAVLPPPPPAWSLAQPPAPEPDGPAWEVRDSIGGLKAAANTLIELLGSPQRAFARMKPQSDWIGPYCFALFVEGLGYFANLIYTLVLCRMNPDNLRGFALLLTSNDGVVFLAVFAYFFIPLFTGLVLLVNSVLIHFCLILAGGPRQPFQATYRVVCYSFGASAALQFIPVLGFFATLLWNLVLLAAGISKLHGIPMGRSALVIAPVALYTFFFVLKGMGFI